MTFREKLKPFTDDEIYILQQACKYSSFHIVCSGFYDLEFQRSHSEFLNEITEELAERRRK